jgi:hypothetical protein
MLAAEADAFAMIWRRCSRQLRDFDLVANEKLQQQLQQQQAQQVALQNRFLLLHQQQWELKEERHRQVLLAMEGTSFATVCRRFSRAAIEEFQQMFLMQAICEGNVADLQAQKKRTSEEVAALSLKCGDLTKQLAVAKAQLAADTVARADISLTQLRRDEHMTEMDRTLRLREDAIALKEANLQAVTKVRGETADLRSLQQDHREEHIKRCEKTLVDLELAAHQRMETSWSEFSAHMAALLKDVAVDRHQIMLGGDAVSREAAYQLVGRVELAGRQQLLELREATATATMSLAEGAARTVTELQSHLWHSLRAWQDALVGFRQQESAGIESRIRGFRLMLEQSTVTRRSLGGEWESCSVLRATIASLAEEEGELLRLGAPPEMLLLE